MASWWSQKRIWSVSRSPMAWLWKRKIAWGQMGGRQTAMRPARRSSSRVTCSRPARGWSGAQAHTTGQRASSRYRARWGAVSRKEKIRSTSPSARRFSRESKGIIRSTGSRSGSSCRRRHRVGRSIRSSALLRQPISSRLGVWRASFIRALEISSSFRISPAYWVNQKPSWVSRTLLLVRWNSFTPSSSSRALI